MLLFGLGLFAFCLPTFAKPSMAPKARPLSLSLTFLWHEAEVKPGCAQKVPG